jgi:hypothetical protein
MKGLYFVKIQNTSTKQVKVRQLLLSKKSIEGLLMEIGKSEGVYLLLDVWR